MAGVASVMCSYNLVNGTYACENNNTLNGVLKNELGFQGFVMSDWFAQHSTLSAVTGLDMTMPGTSYFGANLTAYVRNGTIPESRVDDMATRILASWYLLGQDSLDYPVTNFNAFFPHDEATNDHIDVQGNHGKLVREIGTASIVLLKNVNNTLPLWKPRKLVLIGSDAGPGRIAGPNEFEDQGGVDGVLAMGWGSG
jgi:beta-glucosidase